MIGTQLQPFYPDFVPNQVLTNTQLNQLRTYLDEQTRQSRVRLTGTGIVCGLTWSGDAASGITVQEGFGITSEGYLIGLDPTDTYTHTLAYTDPGVDENGQPTYEHWQKANGTQRDILELVTGGTGAQPLTAQMLAGRVLVLYLEEEDVDLKSCFVTDCNNNGLNVQLTARLLLVEEAAFTPLDTSCPNRPVLLHVPRFHAGLRVAHGLALSQVAKPDHIDDSYGQIVTDLRDPLIDRLRDAFNTYQVLLDLDDAHGTTIDGLAGMLPDGGTFNQYHYDFVKELAGAYNEFVTLACALIRQCCPNLTIADARYFPRHLLLGALDETDGYRHDFMPSPVRNVLHADLERARKLFVRAMAMIEAFRNEGVGADQEGVKITPSQTELAALGERAVPYYYGFGTDIAACWQPPTCCTGAPPWSYHTDLVIKDPLGYGLEALNYDYGAFSFMRIEGQLGLDCNDARIDILKLRVQHNLDFDLRCLYLYDGGAEEAALLQQIDQDLRTLRELLDKHVEAVRAGGDVKDSEAQVAQIRKDLGLIGADWGGLRSRRALLCDVTALENDYLLLRSELHTAFRRVTALFPDQTDRDDELIEGIRTKELVPGDLVGGVITVTEEEAGFLQAFLTAFDEERLVRVRIEDILQLLLPRDVLQFNLPLFVGYFKSILKDLVELRLHLWPYFDVPFLMQGELYEDLWAPFSLIYDGVYARLVTLSYTFDQVRANDLSLFSNFARAHPGLEHLAGVEKGGTFLLVCDNEDTDTVVADFAVAGSAPCCCDIDLDSFCLPPVAMPDLRAVVIDPEDIQPIDIEIHLVGNDLDLNGATKTFEVIVSEEDTGQQGTVKPDEERPGVVRYQNDEPTPNTVDVFSYTLRDLECDLEDTGCLAVLIRESVLIVGEEPVDQGVVMGTVRDASTGTALAGITVKLEDPDNVQRETTSNSNGFYQFSDVVPHTYDLEVDDNDYEPFEETFTVAEGEVVARDINLIPIQVGGEVEGVISGADGEIPFGARVELVEIKRVAFANNAGFYQHLNVPAGTYTVRVTRSGYRDAEQTGAQVTDGSTLLLDFMLQTGTARLGGRVIDASTNEGIGGAVVTLTNRGGISQTTFDNGAYLFEEVESGIARTRVTAQGYESVDRLAILDPDEIHTSNYFLEPTTGLVRGTVLFFDRTPVKDATVTAVEQKVTVPVASDGSFEIALDPGSHTLVATRSGLTEGRKTLELSRGSVLRQDFTLFVIVR